MSKSVLGCGGDVERGVGAEGCGEVQEGMRGDIWGV